jgi:hypothetical protein
MRYSDAIEAGYDGPSPAQERRYRNEIMRHPDCRDPDHPGCDSCMGESGEDCDDE